MTFRKDSNCEVPPTSILWQSWNLVSSRLDLTNRLIQPLRIKTALLPKAANISINLYQFPGQKLNIDFQERSSGFLLKTIYTSSQASSKIAILRQCSILRVFHEELYHCWIIRNGPSLRKLLLPARYKQKHTSQPISVMENLANLIGEQHNVARKCINWWYYSSTVVLQDVRKSWSEAEE